MKRNQLTRGLTRRVMYIENKDGLLDGVSAHIGWVEFSKSGRSVYYRGRTLNATTRAGAGNFVDAESGEEYWVSGIKTRGSNVHHATPVGTVAIDEDAKEEFVRLKQHDR